MDVNGWVAVIGAVGVVLVQLLQMVLSYYRDRDKTIKLEEINDNINHNTDVTKIGTNAAADHAMTATEVGKETKTAIEDVKKQLNGALDGRIADIVKRHFDPLAETVRAHADQDEKSIAEVKAAIGGCVTTAKMNEFAEYVHERNHDMLGALNTQGVKIDAILKTLEDMGKKGANP